MELQHELLQLLACPRCRGSLEMRGDPLQGLSCAACALLFPVRDGIPVMLLEEALPLGEGESGAPEQATFPNRE